MCSIQQSVSSEKVVDATAKPEAQFVIFAAIGFLEYRQPDFTICDDVRKGKYSHQARKCQL